METNWRNFTKKILSSFILFNTVGYFLSFYQVKHPSIGLNIYQHLENQDYSVEEHIVETEDGFLLTVQRIPCDRKKTFCAIIRPPILLMSGMSSSSDAWVCRDINNSLALLLVEKGFDVWLGNNRGNTWSRNHTKLDPDRDVEFWNYSYNEMGMFDLPATIDYILKKTDNKKLTYIGYSQGFTQLLVMGAERPEYNAKIKLACGIAPVTNMHKISNPIIRLLGYYNKYFQWFTKTLNIYKIGERHSTEAKLLQNIAFVHPIIFELLLQRVCMKVLLGSSNNIDKYNSPYCLYSWPAGISIKQLNHFTQGFITGNFSKYDYGFEKNEKIYHSTYPPSYNLTKVSMPMALYYSQNDTFNNNVVMEKILLKVPNIVEKYLVPVKDFNHADFLMSNNVTDLLYFSIIQIIEKYHNRLNSEV